MKNEKVHLGKIIIFLFVSWSLLIIFLGVYQVRHIRQNTTESGLIQAETAIKKDMIYWQWNSDMGGTYVETTRAGGTARPNHLGEEHAELTINNKEYSLLPPVNMIKMAASHQRAGENLMSRFSSLTPVNPENYPGGWEAQALPTLKDRDDVYHVYEEVGSKTYLRYMKAFIVDKSCLKCHSNLDYIIGNIGGGISVSIPMNPLLALEKDNIYHTIVNYLLIWLVGTAVLALGHLQISRQLALQEAVKKEKETLQSQLLHSLKLESVGQLAAGIAHEINTPVQFITTNLDFIDDASHDISAFMAQVKMISEHGPRELADSIEHAFKKMDWDYLAGELPLAISQSREGAERVASIVRAMKEFSQPSSDKREPRDLNRIVENTVTISQNRWKYVADVKLDLVPYLPDIPLLADEMGQVILNILINAADAISERSEGGGHPQKGLISISTRALDDRLQLRIGDNGIGIPEEIRHRIFDPFFTTKAVDKGYGQGLAICLDVITEKHGGRMDFMTERHTGTEMIIDLPLTEDDRL